MPHSRQQTAHHTLVPPTMKARSYTAAGSPSRTALSECEHALCCGRTDLDEAATARPAHRDGGVRITAFKNDPQNRRKPSTPSSTDSKDAPGLVMRVWSSVKLLSSSMQHHPVSNPCAHMLNLHIKCCAAATSTAEVFSQHGCCCRYDCCQVPCAHGTGGPAAATSLVPAAASFRPPQLTSCQGLCHDRR